MGEQTVPTRVFQGIVQPAEAGDVPLVGSRADGITLSNVNGDCQSFDLRYTAVVPDSCNSCHPYTQDGNKLTCSAPSMHG